jgi:hypothetical protein
VTKTQSLMGMASRHRPKAETNDELARWRTDELKSAGRALNENAEHLLANENAEHVLANIEKLGVQNVRNMVWSGRWPANYDALAKEWLRQKDAEERERKEAHGEAQIQKDTKKPEREDADGEPKMSLARKCIELAHSTRDAALEANKRALDANTMAREAKNIAWSAAASVERSAKTTKRIAIAALVAALIAIAIPIVALFIRWPPALEALISIMWQR